jgi:hypothetical protein
MLRDDPYDLPLCHYQGRVLWPKAKREDTDLTLPIVITTGPPHGKPPFEGRVALVPWRSFKTKDGLIRNLKNVHKVGHPLPGVVVGYHKRELHGFYSCDIEVKADTAYRAIVHLFGKAEAFEEELIPERGSVIETVVKNHAGDTLYLSTDPDDLRQTGDYQAYYQFIETLTEGTSPKESSNGLWALASSSIYQVHTRD